MGFEVELRGLAWWTEREDWQIEFTRLLGAAQDGGSTVAECYIAARRIEGSDDHAWHREWKRLADTSRRRGNEAREKGHMLTARSNWLRAINYYQSAAFSLDPEDGDHRAAIESMRRCARDYLRHRIPSGEVVQIPLPGSYQLEAYFLPAPETARPAPAIICIGEPGQRKEEYLHKVERHARDRGMSMLAVDLFGAGSEDANSFCDLELTIGHVMDHLVARDDVDRDRIAVLADGWGSSFVARGIALDGRFAAAVCDGGIWDLHERIFMIDRDAPLDTALIRRLGLAQVARNIDCPVLISTGERGWLRAERVRELYRHLKAEGADVTLKIFGRGETASLQGHVDNPTLANEYIFDWLASRLGIKA